MLKVFIYVLSMFCSGNTFLEIKIVCQVNLCHSASKSRAKKGLSKYTHENVDMLNISSGEDSYCPNQRDRQYQL